MEMLIQNNTNYIIEIRPDNWNWGSKERDGVDFSIIRVTEEWMEGLNWMQVRQFYDEFNADGSRVWSISASGAYNNGVYFGSMEYTTLYGNEP